MCFLLTSSWPSYPAWGWIGIRSSTSSHVISLVIIKVGVLIYLAGPLFVIKPYVMNPIHNFCVSECCTQRRIQKVVTGIVVNVVGCSS